MAIGVTTSAQITKAKKLFVAAAIFTGDHRELLAGLVDKKTLPEGQGDTWNEPYWPTMTAGSLTEGVAISSPFQVTDNGISISTGEVGAEIIFTKRMARRISENFATVAGKLLGRAIAVKKDRDLLALGATASVSLGSSSTTLVAGLIGACVSGIETGLQGTARSGVRDSGDPGDPPYSFVAHPYNRYDLASQLSGLGPGGPGSTTAIGTTAASTNFGGNPIDSGLSAEVLRRHFGGSVMGADTYFTGQLVPSSNAVNAIAFSKDAMVLVQFQNLDVEQMWNPQRRAWEWIAVEDYGYGVRADAHLRKIVLDATPPAA